jgi:colanic acid/amylovoran biosynthesis protein
MNKRKILILHFPNLNNYGTGMLGLITIQALADNCGKDEVEFYCDLNEHAIIDEIKKELSGIANIKRYVNIKSNLISKTKNPILRKIKRLKYFLFNSEYKQFDRIIVLGGDDLSEIYSKNSYNVAIELLFLWRASFNTKVFLIGQTLGPFNHPINRYAIRYLLPRLKVYARDLWTKEYIKNEFGISIKISADPAINDLPLQNNNILEKNTLIHYKLQKGKYFTIVISGLQKNDYYCEDYNTYLQNYKEVIEQLLKKPYLKDKKVCLLAHTFPPYADESSIITDLFNILPECSKESTIIVSDRILQTKARFVLGNGLFTITGRMHAAVSTFQMGRPAICLSYSPKYKGVIGGSIGRNDLIIEANDRTLWYSRAIKTTIEDKVDYLISNYENICIQISTRINDQKKLVTDLFQNISQN